MLADRTKRKQRWLQACVHLLPCLPTGPLLQCTYTTSLLTTSDLQSRCSA